jgi:hypothetical protein
LHVIDTTQRIAPRAAGIRREFRVVASAESTTPLRLGGALSHDLAATYS